MKESETVEELLDAHADVQRLTEEIVDARERRRHAAQRLIDSNCDPSWIAERLGVTRQAVDGFLRYQEQREAGR